MVTHSFGVSVDYARASLALQDQLERGEINEVDFARAGMRLSEMHPDDYRHARRLIK